MAHSRLIAKQQMQHRPAISSNRNIACHALPAFKAEAAAAVMASAALLLAQPALADLNAFEAAAGGEFGRGSAMQYGEADIQGRDFSGQARHIRSVWSRTGTGTVCTRLDPCVLCNSDIGSFYDVSSLGKSSGASVRKWQHNSCQCSSQRQSRLRVWWQSTPLT